MLSKNMYKFSLMDADTAIQMAHLQINAYPAIGYTATPEAFAERIKEIVNSPDVNFYNAYDSDDVLVGGFNIWDFEMNLRQTMIRAGGIGSVAVDLCRKKEKVCKDIVEYFIQSLRANGVNMALLYPFNPAFYHKMGFGNGTLLQQFRIKPEDLPAGNSKSRIVKLNEDHADALTDFYNSHAKSTHGLISKTSTEFAKRLKAPPNKIFAYMDDKIRGYIVFQFKKGSEESFLVNDIVVSELLFDSPEVFAELMAFIKSQSDQIRYVIINTQDEGLFNAIPDPRNHMERILFSVYQECCRTGLGIMYRICDIRGFFTDIANCRFGNLTTKLQLNVNDTFVADNNGELLLEFINGQCKIVDGVTPDVELSIDIAELSSLVMGCVNLKQLVRYGKAKVSDVAWLDALSCGFYLDEKPVCLSYF